MTSTLAGAFRASFKAIVAAFGLAVLAGAGGYVLAGGSAFLGLAFAGLGLALLVVLFGLVALQIENTELLARIALAVEGQDGRAARMIEASDEAPEPQPAAPQAAPRAFARMAEDPAPRVAAGPRKPQGPQGRVEPVVTLRRTAG